MLSSISQSPEYYALFKHVFCRMSYAEGTMTLRKKCPYSEFFWSAFSRIRTRITPNTDTFHAVWRTTYTIHVNEQLLLLMTVESWLCFY